MALSIFDNLEEANDELEKIEDEIEIPHITKEEILKNYDFNFDVDSETLEFLKEQTIKVHKKGNTFYTELGKIFKETQEKLANNKTGVFRKWFESIGLNKTFVYDNIARYNYIVRQTDNIKIEKVESLPVTLTYEIAKDSCPELIRERVIGGEIRTKAELKKALKEVKQEKIEEATPLVQEAEIIEDYDALMKKEFEEIMEVLSSAEVKANRSKNNLDALIKIKKILNGME